MDSILCEYCVEKQAQLNGLLGSVLMIQCLAFLVNSLRNFRLCTEKGH